MHNTWFRTLLLAAPLIVTLNGCGKPKKSAAGNGKTNQAAKTKPALPTANQPIDQSYITDDFVAAAVFHPARLMKDELARDLIAVAREDKAGGVHKTLKFIEDNFGIESNEIEQVIVLCDGGYLAGLAIAIAREQPYKTLPGVIVRYSGTLDEASLLPALVKAAQVRSGQGMQEATAPQPAKKSHAGKTYYVLNNGDDAFAFVGGHTLVAAPEATLKKMLAAGKPTSPLARLLGTIGAEHNVILAAAGQPFEDLVTTALAIKGLNDEKKTELAGKLESVAVTQGGSKSTMASIVVGMADATSASQLAELLNKETIQQIKKNNQKARSKGNISAEEAKLLDEQLESLAVGANETNVIIRVAQPSRLDDIRALIKSRSKKKP